MLVAAEGWGHSYVSVDNDNRVEFKVDFKGGYFKTGQLS